MYWFDPFGKFVVEVVDTPGLWNSSGPAGVSVAKEVPQTPTGVGTVHVDAPSMAAARVRPSQTLILIFR